MIYQIEIINTQLKKIMELSMFNMGVIAVHHSQYSKKHKTKIYKNA